MTQQNLDERIGPLLRRVADEAVPADLDLMPAITRRLRAGAQPPRMPPRPMSLPRWAYPAVAVVVLLALIVSAFTWARPYIFSWLGTPGLEAATLQHATIINRSVTVNGVTLHVEQAYADAALTAVTFRLTRAHATSASGHVELDAEPMLVGADQARYGSVTGVGLNDEYLQEFVPLPLDQLNAPQTLTLVFPTLRGASTQTGPGPTISGPWQLTFQVNPQPGRSISYDLAPSTHDGVTIQPLRLDIAPSGARLLLRISGLAPNTELLPLKHFVVHQELGGLSPSSGLGMRVGISEGSTSDGGPLQLRGPDGQRLVPAWIAPPTDLPATDQGLPLNQQVVGPGGTAVLSVLFFTPLSATHGLAHLMLDQVDIVTRDAAGNESERLAHGPWSFDLPL